MDRRDEGPTATTDDVGRVALPRHHHIRQLIRFTLGLVVGVGALWLVVSAAGGLGDALDALRNTDIAWLVPALAFEALSYLLGGLRLQRLAGLDADLSPLAATEVALVVDGLGLLTPASPAEGLAFEYQELTRRGLSPLSRWATRNLVSPVNDRG